MGLVPWANRNDQGRHHGTIHQVRDEFRSYKGHREPNGAIGRYVLVMLLAVHPRGWVFWVTGPMGLGGVELSGHVFRCPFFNAKHHVEEGLLFFTFQEIFDKAEI